MNGALAAADRAVGDKGIAGTGFGPRAVVAPIAALGALAGNETCADLTETIAAQWAARGGDRLGELIAARLNKSPPVAGAGATVDQVVAAPAPAADVVTQQAPSNGRIVGAA